MGHEVEKAAIERGHQIVLALDNASDWSTHKINAREIDVVIDFSTPASAAWIVNHCLESGIPVVSGTTGWPAELEKIKERCLQLNGTFFYAPNFSIGVNIFFEINRKLASLLNNHRQYQASLHEIHHIHKLDAPSGTAIALANDIIAENHAYQSWQASSDKQACKLPVTSERSGEVPGTHIVQWESSADSIEIKHTAHNRQGFATGAVLAAEWLSGKTGVFDMQDLLNSTT